MRLFPIAALAFTLALAPGAASAEDEARRAAHEAVRAALLERASLPARPPELPQAGTALEPGRRAEHARRADAEQRAAHERAVRRGEQHRARHVEREEGTAGGHQRGARDGDAAGACRDAAGDVRTREMHGGMDGDHSGGPGDGPHMDGR